MELLVELVGKAGYSSYDDLNAAISASRLGDDGRVLAAIAMLMRREAGETELAIRAAADTVEPTREATGDVGFDVCLAKIQAEMALFFLDELTRGRGDDDAAQNVRLLLTASAGRRLEVLADSTLRHAA